MESHHLSDHRRYHLIEGVTTAHGFSLVELVIVIIVISIAAVPLLGLFRGVGDSLLSNDDLQVAQQTAQACGEHVLGLRRRNPSTGYASITSTSCNILPVPAGFTRPPLTITNPTANPCPTGASCKSVYIAVTKGTLIADITLLLTNY